MNLEQINHLENIQKAAENLNGVIRKTDLIQIVQVIKG